MVSQPNHEPFLRRLGEAIRSARRQRGMGRRELAEAAGLSYPYVAQLENGDRDPSSRTLLALSGALGLSPEQLFSWTDPPALVEALAEESRNDYEAAPTTTPQLRAPRRRVVESEQLLAQLQKAARSLDDETLRLVIAVVHRLR